MSQAIILMTRIPWIEETKTRLSDFFSPEERENFSLHLLEKNLAIIESCSADCFVAVHPIGYQKEVEAYLSGRPFEVFEQSAGDLGEKMSNAFKHLFERGYQSIILIGSDLFNLSHSLIEEAFDQLNQSSVEAVITPTADGGYGLIGMSKYLPELFNISSYGHSEVFERVMAVANDHRISIQSIGELRDIDDKEDVAVAITGDPGAKFLAQGEYNANFIFDNERRLLRIALGSQMHLENQIEYEYHALKGLATSGVVPPVYELVAYHPLIGKGYLIERYLPGRSLNYDTDLTIAAELLARVHSVPPEDIPTLIKVDQPFRTMLEEFETMFEVYQQWEYKDTVYEKRILALLDQLKQSDLNEPINQPVVINTELNASNFLINDTSENSYIIDWEKPLIGEKEQDLAHFLAPTTTLWKTNKVFTEKEIEHFIAIYNRFSRFEVDRSKLNQYLLFTCMRGMTWCAMAYVEYMEASKTAMNPQTFNVIKRYLTEEYLSAVEQRFNNGGFITP